VASERTLADKAADSIRSIGPDVPDKKEIRSIKRENGRRSGWRWKAFSKFYSRERRCAGSANVFRSGAASYEMESRALSSNLKIARGKKIAILFHARARALCFTSVIKLYAACISGTETPLRVSPLSRAIPRAFALLARYSNSARII